MPTISQQIEEINKIFINFYLRELKKGNELEQKNAENLEKIFSFQDEGEKSFEDFTAFIKRKILQSTNDDAEITFADLKSNEAIAPTMTHFAKISDVLRRIRVIANQQYFEQNFSTTIADSADYVLQALEDNRFGPSTTPEKAQDLLNKVQISTITTSHPTNPNSVEYTAKAMDLAEKMVKFSGIENDTEALELGLQAIIQAPLIAAKKTQEKEVEEGLLYLKSIYNSVPLAYDKLRESIIRPKNLSTPLPEGAVVAEEVATGKDAKEYAEKYTKLQLPKKLFNFATWITGDGDGNPNSTEATLKHQINEFRKAIKQLYLQDLTSDPRLAAVDLKAATDFLESINTNAETGANLQQAAAQFVKILQDKTAAIQGTEERKALQEITIKAQNFGLHFATIDIRHESRDIMKTVAGLLKAVGAIDHTDHEKLASEDLRRFFQDADIVEKIQQLDYKTIAPYQAAEGLSAKEAATNNELVKRIFGRLKTIAQNPDMSEKFIIAEFQGEKNIQAVFLLLKASGNEVQNEKARINIVPLAEEKDKLEQLPECIAEALRDPSYLEHVKQTKEIYFMIAKSDTIRRGGVGAQLSQEFAVRNSIKSIIKTLLEQGVEDLENYKIIPYNGGGHALQRGGGRITELPSVYGRYYLRALQELAAESQKEYEAEKAQISATEETDAKPRLASLKAKHEAFQNNIKKAKINAPYFTVQGHQNGILFSPAQDVGAGTLASLASQAFYAEARLAGEIPDNEVEDEIFNPHDLEFAKRIADKIEKAEDAKEFVCNQAFEYYKELTTEFYKQKEGDQEIGPINRLFENACWVSTKTGNESSRASVRGVAELGAKATAIGEIKGEKNLLLDQRAIGSEKLCAHSGTNLISWFGWGKALQDLKNQQEKYGSLNEMHKASKSMRDYMRSSAMSLYMTNFTTSWQMMVGCARPSNQEIAHKAQDYEEKMARKDYSAITKDETMSYIEVQAENTKRLIYETVTGKAVGAGQPFDLLEKYLEVKKEIDNRKKDCRFANVMQTVLTDLTNRNPQEDFTQDLSNLVKASYRANDTVVNTPISAALSLTKERGKNIAVANEDQLRAIKTDAPIVSAVSIVKPEQEKPVVNLAKAFQEISRQKQESVATSEPRPASAVRLAERSIAITSV